MTKGWEKEKKMTGFAVTVNERSRVDGICYLFLIFLAGCLLGYLYEEIFYWFTEGMLRNRGILFGPWLPIYGIGALGIYALKPLKSYPILLFLLCALISGVVEYIIGYAGIRLFDMRLWDYRGLFLNIQGIICLRSVLSFSVMGVVFHYLLEPLAEQTFQRTDPDKIRIFCVVVLGFLLFDCVLSVLFRVPITY